MPPRENGTGAKWDVAGDWDFSVLFQVLDCSKVVCVGGVRVDVGVDDSEKFCVVELFSFVLCGGDVELDISPALMFETILY